MDSWSFITIVVFLAFMGMLVMVLWPTKGEKPYKDAEKLALKNDNDPIITPRHTSSDKRTKT